MARMKPTVDKEFQQWLLDNGYTGNGQSGYQLRSEIEYAKGHDYVTAPVGMQTGTFSFARPEAKTYQEADVRQKYQQSLQQTAITNASKNAVHVTAPGQDIFSKKLAGMASGQFAPDDPSYQWRLQQGQQAVERSAAARGQLGSGNILTALTDYGQGAASQEYSAQFQRMLQGSQNVTQQYGAAYNALAQMMGQQTGQAQVGVQATGQALDYSMKNKQFNAQQDYLKNQEAGQAQALYDKQHPTGAAYWAQQEQAQPSYANQPMTSYQPASSGQMQSYYASDPGMQSGSGYMTNNSTGATVSFGGGDASGGFGG